MAHSMKIFQGGDKLCSMIRAAAILSCRYELIAEIIEVFGEENLDKLLSVFGGRVIRIPTKKEFRTALERIAVWVACSEEDPTERSRKEGDLVRVLGLSRSKIQTIYKSMQDVMEPLGLEVREVSGKEEED